MYGRNRFVSVKSAADLFRPINQDESICCWYDKHPIGKNQAVYSMPIDYNWEKDAWSLSGCFCGWGCVRAYNERETRDNDVTYRNSLIHFLIKRVHMVEQVGPIPVAYHWKLLKCFGGMMDILEYRKHNALTFVGRENLFAPPAHPDFGGRMNDDEGAMMTATKDRDVIRLSDGIPYRTVGWECTFNKTQVELSTMKVGCLKRIVVSQKEIATRSSSSSGINGAISGGSSILQRQKAADEEAGRKLKSTVQRRYDKLMDDDRKRKQEEQVLGEITKKMKTTFQTRVKNASGEYGGDKLVFKPRALQTFLQLSAKHRKQDSLRALNDFKKNDTTEIAIRRSHTNMTNSDVKKRLQQGVVAARKTERARLAAEKAQLKKQKAMERVARREEARRLRLEKEAERDRKRQEREEKKQQQAKIKSAHV